MGTNKTYLPPKDTKEAGEIIRRCKAGESNKVLAELGYTTRKAFSIALLGNYGVRVSEICPTRERVVAESPVPEVIIKTPAIKVRKYKPSHQGKGDPETQVVLLGDHHAGEKTPTYNSSVYKKRLENIYQSTLRINDLHRHLYPIDDLVIILLGDMVHGENPRQGAKLGATECGAVDQVYDLAFPELFSFMKYMRESFKTVSVYGVWGNHGRVSIESPETSNWDNMLYKALAKSSLPDGVTMIPPTDFCQMVNINGFGFLCYHGDQIRMSNGVPYFSQRRHLKDWYFAYDGFAYACQGHFHGDDYLRISSKTKLFTNGPLVSDDPYALAKIGTSTIPSQWTFGVHNRTGVSWAYALTADQAFFPERRECK